MAGPSGRNFDRCPACGGSRLEGLHCDCPDRRHWLPGRFDVVRCAACGLGRTTPQPTADSLASWYPGEYVSFAATASGSRGRVRLWLRSLLRFPYACRYGIASRRPAAEANRLLDVGCGTGVFLEEMSSLGWEAWGIEPSLDAAAAAVERISAPSGRIFVGGIEEAEFPHENFDLVTMFHVLEHVADPAEALAKIHRWLRPGGRLEVRVPNIGSLESRVFGRLWFGLDIPRHLHHFSRESLLLLLKRAGFSSVRAVPELQGSSLTGSVSHLVDAVLRRHRDYHHSQALYYAVLPVASLLAAAGSAATLEVTARRP